MKSVLTHILRILLFFTLVMGHMAAAEEPSINQSVEQYSAVSEIYGGAISHAHGALSVNQASGDGNAQNNSRAIAVTQDGGVAVAYTMNSQVVTLNQTSFPDTAVSRISDQAFNGVSGLISVNQASGAQNRQLNAFAMALSINGELSDASLAKTYTEATVAEPDGISPLNSVRSVDVDSTAFVGAGGIVQINQASGLGNATSNRFEISVGHAD